MKSRMYANCVYSMVTGAAQKELQIFGHPGWSQLGSLSDDNDMATTEIMNVYLTGSILTGQLLAGLIEHRRGRRGTTHWKKMMEDAFHH